MKLIYIFFAVIFLTASCNSTYTYWDISKFNMDSTALSDKEEVSLLYSSRAPDNNDQLGYYIHVIVVSKKTGDTVNVLTTANNGFTINDKDKLFNYLSPNNPLTKMIQLDSNEFKSIDNIDQLNSLVLKNIQKVVRDPKFDYIADNTFPTVIGAIATITNTNDK